MRLQTIIFPNSVCGDKELYYRENKEIDSCSFLSYMNVFDMDAWKKYTNLRHIQLKVILSGSGVLCIKGINEGNTYVISKETFNVPYDQTIQISTQINMEQYEGQCYIEVIQASKAKIYEAWFEAGKGTLSTQNVLLALNICTYHRNEDVQRSLSKLRQSRFFDKLDELYHKLQIVVVDNGAELEEVSESCIKLVHHSNTGGSGGFQRGLKEIRQMKEPITHVIFMDDDVEFLNETFYRLYGWLSYLKKEYQHEAVAGRMFRLDERKIQYTASEIWNYGNVKHIGWNLDMSQLENIPNVNQNTGGEYGGWWFCCYPAKFAKENEPLPFFLHCDDVEYGLRHGGTPMILNGIQVWHETYEYRQGAVIAYYDTRNAFLVNQILGYRINYKSVLDDWFAAISKAHLNGDFQLEYCIILGLRHALRGRTWLEKINPEINHYKIEKARANKFLNALLWRDTKRKYQRKFRLNTK